MTAPEKMMSAATCAAHGAVKRAMNVRPNQTNPFRLRALKHERPCLSPAKVDACAATSPRRIAGVKERDEPATPAFRRSGDETVPSQHEVAATRFLLRKHADANECWRGVLFERLHHLTEVVAAAARTGRKGIRYGLRACALS